MKKLTEEQRGILKGFFGRYNSHDYCIYYDSKYNADVISLQL